MNTHLNVLYKKADHIARYVVRSFRNYYTVTRAIRKRARLREILLELGSRRQTYMLLFLLIKKALSSSQYIQIIPHASMIII